MKKDEVKAWLTQQVPAFKNLVLLQFANELTLIARDISTSGDEELRLKAGWIISECQHRILGYVTASMTGQPTYPDEVIVEIIFDHISHPVLRERTQSLWDSAIERAERFGSALKSR